MILVSDRQLLSVLRGFSAVFLFRIKGFTVLPAAFPPHEETDTFRLLLRSEETACKKEILPQMPQFVAMPEIAVFLTFILNTVY